MNQYWNVSEGEIEIPVPGSDGTRKLAVGESFFGPAYYDRFITDGILAKAKAELCQHRRFVASAQINTDDAIAATSVPYRYKSDQKPPNQGSTGTTSYGQLLYTLAFARDAGPDDPALITYYFYTIKEAANRASHIISLVEVLGLSWHFPTWAALPSNFHSLSPLEQRTALLLTT